MKRRQFLQATTAVFMLCTSQAYADSMADAKAVVDRYATAVTKWDGPATGPKAQTGKTIVVLAGDLKNGGILGVSNGVEEAAKAIGWQDRKSVV